MSGVSLRRLFCRFKNASWHFNLRETHRLRTMELLGQSRSINQPIDRSNNQSINQRSLICLSLSLMYSSTFNSGQPIFSTYVWRSDFNNSCQKELHYTYILEINELQTFCVLKHNHSSTTFRNIVNLLQRTSTASRTLKVLFNKIMSNVWKASDKDAFANRDLFDGNLCIIQTSFLAFGLYFREI